MEQLKKFADFLKSVKELAAVIVALVLMVVAGINYFVTRNEMKQLQCQIMAMMEIANDQIVILNGRREQDVEMQEISFYNGMPNLTETQIRMRDQKRNGYDNLEKAITRYNEKVSGIKTALERGDCYSSETKGTLPQLKEAIN